MNKKLLLIIIPLLFLVGMYIEATEQNVEVEIAGLSRFCTVAVKKSLLDVEGVDQVKVSFKEKKAWFIADETVADDDIYNAVAAIGNCRVVSMEKENRSTSTTNED